MRLGKQAPGIDRPRIAKNTLWYLIIGSIHYTLTGIASESLLSASLLFLREWRSSCFNTPIRFSTFPLPGDLSGETSTTINFSTISGWFSAVTIAVFPPMLWPIRVDFLIPCSRRNSTKSLFINQGSCEAHVDSLHDFWHPEHTPESQVINSSIAKLPVY